MVGREKKGCNKMKRTDGMNGREEQRRWKKEDKWKKFPWLFQF